MVGSDELKKISVFAGLSERHLSELGKIGVAKHFNKGDVIFSEKSKGKGLYFVISGRIKIYKTAAAGHIKVLSYLNKGDVFGEMAIFGGTWRSASALAMAKSKILLIKAQNFKDFTSKNTDVLLKIIATLIERLKRAGDEIKSLAYTSVLARTAFVLIDFAHQYGIRKGAKIVINFPLTHVEIASNVGSSREVISRMLAKLGELKYIEYQKKQIAILNLQGLKKIIY
ncbi:MAG: hypothetical protein COT16_03835 [Elusimicrobia bacterium CG08_land_8_20_14_0_20_44_26]|nr:MAG: hypothetical protein COT16_03835 [Elusimicrobia bacterium CG08_land_8_20_14_0_20_44_26]